MLQCVIVLVDLVENAPRNIKLDPLSHGVQLVPVVLVLLLTRHLNVSSTVRVHNHYFLCDLLIKFRAHLLHHLIEYGVVLFTDLLLLLQINLGHLAHAHTHHGSAANW